MDKASPTPPLAAENRPDAIPEAGGWAPSGALTSHTASAQFKAAEPSVCRCPACSTLRVSGGAVEAATTAVAAAGTVASLSLLDTFKLHSNPWRQSRSTWTSMAI
ncbi:hypothetical protein [Cyanobium sp. ATX-6F1]|uniref:hypothetical protein n=1 Tax=Cyanobium sp. ATX-6F1 TaxID=3137388 RepID=UPI0039BEC5F2